jgi:hypothetical protein
LTPGPAIAAGLKPEGLGAILFPVRPPSNRGIELSTPISIIGVIGDCEASPIGVRLALTPPAEPILIGARGAGKTVFGKRPRKISVRITFVSLLTLTSIAIESPFLIDFPVLFMNCNSQSGPLRGAKGL